MIDILLFMAGLAGCLLLFAAGLLLWCVRAARRQMAEVLAPFGEMC